MEDLKIYKLEDFSLTDYEMLYHLSLAKCHIAAHKGTIVCPGSPLDGKAFLQKRSTPKINGEFGKATYEFKLAEPNAPSFTTLEDFLKHYHKNIEL